MNERAVHRMTAEERREQILGAALRVFAEGGYAATTTDQVARAAGVSQPYVVRMFGTKHHLFAEVYRRACGELIEAFEAVPAGPEASDAMGRAYVAQVVDRDRLLMIMHGFLAGAEPEIGEIARRTLGRAYRLHRERTGSSEAEARAFVSHGMMISVLLASGALKHHGEDPDIDELTAATLGFALDMTCGT